MHVRTHTAVVDEDCPLELTFLVDSSESAKEKHEQEKHFAMDVVDRLQGLRLQTGRVMSTRVALLQYSSQVIPEQTFKQWLGAENFRALITPIAHIGQGTYTTYAITNMTKMYLDESRGAGSIRVAMLLTDGKSHPENPDILAAVADAKDQGIRFFTLGITRKANETANVAQLRLLASYPPSRYLHNLQDADIVDKVIQVIVSILTLHSLCKTRHGFKVGCNGICATCCVIYLRVSRRGQIFLGGQKWNEMERPFRVGTSARTSMSAGD